MSQLAKIFAGRIRSCAIGQRNVQLRRQSATVRHSRQLRGGGLALADGARAYSPYGLLSFQLTPTSLRAEIDKLIEVGLRHCCVF